MLVGIPCNWLFGSIYNVKCTFTFRIVDGAGSNAAFEESTAREWIDHHYRFSFEIKDLKDLHKKFWEEYLKDNTGNNKNSITVTIIGSTNRFGGHICYRKEYSVDHILIGEDSYGALDKERENCDAIQSGIIKDFLKQEKGDRNLCNVKALNYWLVFKQYREFRDKATEEKRIKDMIEKTYIR
ncbi:MAG: hypothetical protein IJ237_01610 [Oscillospiraceae bacterium]|nr:hypothetical protein [Oscillospiraceae bacterium]